VAPAGIVAPCGRIKAAVTGATPGGRVTSGFSADLGRGPGLGLLERCSCLTRLPGGARLVPGDSISNVYHCYIHLE